MKQMLTGKLRMGWLLVAIFMLAGMMTIAQDVPEYMYYKFDETGSTVTNDASAPVGTNPAPLMGGLTQGGTGEFGGALIGVGGSSSTNYVNTGWAANLPGTPGFTVSLWLNNIPVNTSLYYMWGDNTAGSWRSFIGGVAGAGNIIMRGGGLTDCTVTGVGPGPSVVHWTYDGAMIRGYRDGVLTTSVADPAININGSGPFKVGGYSGSSCMPAGSLIDEFRLYNRPLDDAEIADSWDKELGGGGGATVITIGTGTGSYGIPYYTFYQDARSLMIWDAADIIAAGGSYGEFSTIAFDVSSYNTQTMNGFNILMKNTSTLLPSSFETGMTNVYSGTYAVTGTGWQTINLQTPFLWDGVSNLAVEVCFDNTSYTSSSYVRYTFTNPRQVYHRHYDYSTGCSITSGLNYYYLPNVQLTFTPIDPVAFLEGIVYNQDTGEPIVGAKIEAGGAIGYSVAGGIYFLELPPGTHDVVVSKAGFETQTLGPFVFVLFETTFLDVGLLRDVRPPWGVVAALNAPETAVDISWLTPRGWMEIRYDDGICDNFTVWAAGGNGNAVKFTPVGYPAEVYGGSVHIGTEAEYPPGSDPLQPFGIVIYDDSGPGGTPGQAISDTFEITPTDFGWVEFALFGANITSGNFYLVMIQGGNAPDAAGICIDEDDPQLRSYSQYQGGPWLPASGNFMLRAIVYGQGGPLMLDALGDNTPITASEIDGAIYSHQPETVTGVEGRGWFANFEWSTFNPSNTPLPYSTGGDPNQEPVDVADGGTNVDFAGSSIPLSTSDAVLYDNGPLVNSPGTGSGGADESILESPLTTYGFGFQNASDIHVADDFTVTGAGWNITSMEFFGYQTGSPTTSSFDGIFVAIWDGEPGLAGSSVIWGDQTTNLLATTTWSNIYRNNNGPGGSTNRPIMQIVASTPGLSLTPGSYWVEWSATGTLGSGPWAPPITISGQPTTGNAIQLYLGAWNPLMSGTTYAQGMPFIVNGIQMSPPGDIDYQVWRLLQGDEGNPGTWTSIGTTANTYITDNSWPSLPCNPYRWAVKAIYPGNRVSTAAFSNGLGKCWTAEVTVNVHLSCDSSQVEGTVVDLLNLDYDSTYSATLPASGTATFDNVYLGNYLLTVTQNGYETHTSNHLIMSDVVIDVNLLQLRIPPTDMFVDDKSLFSTWRPPSPLVTVFDENFSGGFTPNGWTAQANWSVNSSFGNPAPSAQFSWAPTQTNYELALTSEVFTGPGAPDFNLSYDINLNNFSASGAEHMTVQINGGSGWVTLADWANTANIPWTTDVVNIGAYTNATFQIRFLANGADSWDINYWYVDNVQLIAVVPDPTDCVLAYNVYLDNALSGVTPDTFYLIPGTHVNYGQDYEACVKAVYGSGYSDGSCYDFTSGFLWPPLNLQVEAVECAAYLTWEQPQIGVRVDIPTFQGEIEKSSILPSAGPAPIDASDIKLTQNSDPNPDSRGSIAFGFEAINDIFIDFDVDDLPAFITIGPTATPNFVGGLAFPMNETAFAYGVVYGSTNLYSCERATGISTLVGNYGGAGFNDFTIDPTTGTYYGTDGSNLWSVDPSGPSSINIGPHGGAANLMIGLACDANGDLWAYDIGNDQFYSIDKTTGLATTIGSIGFNANYAQSMFYDPGTSTITMAAFNLSNFNAEIRAVDVTTGNTTLLSSLYYHEITGSALPIIGGGGAPPGLLGYNVYRDGNFIALVTDGDTTWYYDFDVDPGTHQYGVTAYYDLTPYGFPGEFDESLIEGPVEHVVICGRDLPFCETWDQASFAYNDWTFAPDQGNWEITTAVGLPAPAADFNWVPILIDYEYSLESPILNAGPWNCASVWLDFDWKLVDRNATGVEMLTVEVLWSGMWHEVLEVANNGSVDWTYEHIDITDVGGKALKVRFTAYGENSEDILHWYVDNICVYGICNPPLDLTLVDVSAFDVYLEWTAPTCTSGGGGVVMDFIFDDGSAENGWAINPGFLAWLGNEFPIDPSFSGVITSVDVWFGFGSGASPGLTIDFFDGAQTLVGSSPTFTSPHEDWLNIPINNVPFSGLFYAMVKWDMVGGNNYLGYDENGPFASQDLEWYTDGTVWDKLTVLAGAPPGVFLIRATALVGGDQVEVLLIPGSEPIAMNNTIPDGILIQSGESFDTKNYQTMGIIRGEADTAQLMGYNVYRAFEADPFEVVGTTTDTTYHDVLDPTTPVGSTFYYYVTTTYNDSETSAFLCESPGSDTLTVEWPAVGIDDLGAGSITVFPSPATDIVTIKSSYTINEIEIMSFLGQQVYTQRGVDARTTKVNVSNLRAGVYFVKVTTSQGIRAVKITVTH